VIWTILLTIQSYTRNVEERNSKNSIKQNQLNDRKLVKSIEDFGFFLRFLLNNFKEYNMSYYM
jgi:hypothetical protein